jgi:hypothetical protein
MAVEVAFWGAGAKAEAMERAESKIAVFIFLVLLKRVGVV